MPHRPSPKPVNAKLLSARLAEAEARIDALEPVTEALFEQLTGQAEILKELNLRLQFVMRTWQLAVRPKVSAILGANNQPIPASPPRQMSFLELYWEERENFLEALQKELDQAHADLQADATDGAGTGSEHTPGAVSGHGSTPGRPTRH